MNSLSPKPSEGGWYRTPGYWLIISLLAVPIISPLLRWTSVPCTHDGHLHYHRIAAMRHAWESGIIASRWLPDVAFGYGYPFFNYREALPLYMSLLPHMAGVPLPGAINLFYILSIILAGWFMFLWARDLFGSTAALVSALAYMAAPYLLIDAMIRGNQPESLALAIFPLLGWAGRRFLIGGRPAYFILSALSLTLLALGHNISTLIFVPFLLVYLLFVGWLRGISWKKVTLRLALLFGLGLALSLFYLGPALLELDEITIVQSVNRRGNDFHFNFASLREIFAPVQGSNPALINPPLLIRLGIIPSILAALGVVSALWIRQREQRGHIVFMALAASFFLFMSLAFSEFIWENVPLIEFVQFPWRFIGRAALPVAFLAGVPFALLLQIPRGRGRLVRVLPLITVAVVILILFEAMPMLYPPICQEEAQPTINKVHAYEHNTGLVGVDPAGSYFPKTVMERPDGSVLEANYQEGQIPIRFDSSALPSGAVIVGEHYGPLSAEIELTSPDSFEARYLSFAFPGWNVFVDGEPVPTFPSDPEGLIGFVVPAGDHVVEIHWQMTTTRLLTSLISLAALAGIVVVTILLSRQREQDEVNAYMIQQAPIGDSRRSFSYVFGLLLVVVLVFLVVKFLLLDQVDNPIRRPQPPQVNNSANLNAGELAFMGFNLSQEIVPSGSSFDIDMAWEVSAPTIGDYQSNVWLVGPNGLTWSDKETARPRIYEETVSTSQWLTGQWAWDSREVTVLPGTPPGIYEIALILFDLETLQPLTLTGSSGEVLGPSAVIGQIEVVRPEQPVNFRPQQAMSESIAGLTLLGYSQDRMDALPGEQMQLTFYWEKAGEEQSGISENVALALFDENEKLVQSWLLPAVRSDYPPSDWPVAELVMGQHTLRLPASLKSGQYDFRLEGTPLDSIQVNAPERIFDEPIFSESVGANFSDSAELVGFTVEPKNPEGNTMLTISLVWKGLAEMVENYRVFVHLLDAEGSLLEQSDAEPANWTRPTPGWVAGEYIIDRHQLTLPDEIDLSELILRVGLYDSQTGIRLPVEGSDSVNLRLPGEP